MTVLSRGHHSAGFSLVELLIVVAITGVIGSAILGLYIANVRSYTAQLQVAEAQQNVRAGLESLASDLRMAGFNPGRAAEATFFSGQSDEVQFSMDLNGDGDVEDSNEHLLYSLYRSSGSKRLGKKLAKPREEEGDPVAFHNNQPVAESIDAIGFAYAFDSNADGTLDTDANGRIYWAVIGPNGHWWDLDANEDAQITLADNTDGDGRVNSVDTNIVADPDDIRAVKIWLLGRAPLEDREFSTHRSYLVGEKILTPGDHYRRRLLTTTVLCRNMGS